MCTHIGVVFQLKYTIHPLPKHASGASLYIYTVYIYTTARGSIPAVQLFIHHLLMQQSTLNKFALTASWYTVTWILNSSKLNFKSQLSASQLLNILLNPPRWLEGRQLTVVIAHNVRKYIIWSRCLLFY